RTPPGLGAGSREPSRPNFFRRVVCEGSVEATHRRARGSSVLSSAAPRAINVDSTAMAKKLRALEPRDLALAVDLDLEHAWRVEYVDRGGSRLSPSSPASRRSC